MKPTLWLAGEGVDLSSGGEEFGAPRGESAPSTEAWRPKSMNWISTRAEIADFGDQVHAQHAGG